MVSLTRHKTRRGKENIYDGFVHWRTKQIQKIRKSKHLRNLWASRHDTKSRTGEKTYLRPMATDAQNQSGWCKNPNIYETCKDLNTSQKNRTVGKKRFTMAMATDAQNKSRSKTQKSKHLRNLFEDQNTTPKNRTGGKKRITIATTNAQNKTRRCRNPNIYTTCQDLNTTQKERQQGKKRPTMAMATDTQNKSRRHTNPNIYAACKHLNMTQKTGPRERTDLRLLWPPPYKTKPEDKDIQTFTTHVST